MPEFSLDPDDPRQAADLERLRTRRVAWLGTTGRDGFPHAVPVWFVWHDGAAVIFVQPRSAKTRNLQADPRASFALETAEFGEQWVLLQGTVEFSPEPSSVWVERFRDAYLAKYADELVHLGCTVDRLTGDYSLALLFHPHKLIG